MTSLVQQFKNAIFGEPEDQRRRRTSVERIEKESADSSSSKPKIFSINELNEKFIRNNLYYIIFGVVLYIVIGICVYHKMMKWDLLNTIYFLVITLLTIGYGDYRPLSVSERVFTAFFIIFGIAVCSSAIGAMSSMIQAHQERVNKLRNMRAMLLMKEEEEAAEERARSFAANDNTGNISLSALQSAARSSALTDEATSSPIHAEDDPEYGSEDQPRRSVSSAKRRVSGIFDMAMSLSIERPRKKTLKELRDASLSAFEEDYRQMMLASVFDFVAIFIILIVGMIGMHIVEGWSYGVAFYWATVTIMTVGYGDVTPTSDRGKVFTIFYCLIGCAFMAKVLTDFIRYPLLARMVRNEEEVAKQFTGVSQSPELLENIFDNELHKLVPDLKRNQDEMSKCEFVLVVLHLMNKLEEKDVFLAAKLFDDMDLEMKGYFSRQDMNEKVTLAVERSKQQASRINIDDINNTRGSFSSSIRGTFGNISRKFSETTASPKVTSDSSSRKRLVPVRSGADGNNTANTAPSVSHSWSGNSAGSAMRSALLDQQQHQQQSSQHHVSSSYGGSSSASLYVPPPLATSSNNNVSSPGGNNSGTHRPFQVPAATVTSPASSSSALTKLFAAERQGDGDNGEN